jgi:hypothetical protein
MHPCKIPKAPRVRRSPAIRFKGTTYIYILNKIDPNNLVYFFLSNFEYIEMYLASM